MPVEIERTPPGDLLEQAIEGSGVDVAFRRKLSDGVALGIRVPPVAAKAWGEFIQAATFRAAAASVGLKDGAEAAYSLEVSKVYYYDSEADTTVWMWRFIARGHLSEVIELLSRQDFKAPPMTLTSFPIYGRIVGRPDSLKGIHKPEVASTYVARAAIRSTE
jgi:hypothetical protein